MPYIIICTFCGSSGIRTPDTVSSMTVFKTVPFNHSGKPPINADCTGLEPVNSTVTGWHDSQLHQQSFLRPLKDSNLGPLR